MNRICLALILIAPFWGTLAAARPATVVVVQGIEAPGVRSRILEELILLDFSVRSLDLVPRPSPLLSLPPEVGALVEIHEHGVDLWLRDESGRRTVRLRVERAPDMSDELLSLRAVELLRGRLLPVRTTKKQRLAPSAVDGRKNNKPTTAQEKEPHFEAALGAGATASRGLPLTPHLSVGASYLLPYGLRVGPFAALPIAPTEVNFIGGGLKVWQASYGAEVGFSWSPTPLLRLGASTQVGARQVAFRYEPSVPFSSSSGTKMLPLFGLGVHGDLTPWPWLGARAELRGATLKRTELLAVTSASPPVGVGTESAESTLKVGSQWAAQLSLVARF